LGDFKVTINNGIMQWSALTEKMNYSSSWASGVLVSASVQMMIRAAAVTCSPSPRYSRSTATADGKFQGGFHEQTNAKECDGCSKE
jgi:hypothetical protein